MADDEWEYVEPLNHDHLWRYEPSDWAGGSFLPDSADALWMIRRCVICDRIERRPASTV